MLNFTEEFEIVEVDLSKILKEAKEEEYKNFKSQMVEIISLAYDKIYKCQVTEQGRNELENMSIDGLLFHAEDLHMGIKWNISGSINGKMLVDSSKE